MNKIAKRDILLAIIFTYLFSLLCRYYWIHWASANENFLFNNELMINTNDGYAFGEGAKERILGLLPHPLSYYHSALSFITYFIYKITPFSLETIMLYMSAFFSSLVVVPIILIGNEFKNLKAGSIAALLACIANSYYNRTLSGYYRTDMFALFSLAFIFWIMIKIIKKDDKYNFILLAFFMLLSLWLYPSSFSLNFATVAFFALYTLAFQRKRLINYQALILMLFCLNKPDFFLLALVILYLAFLFKTSFSNNLKFLISFFILASLVFIYNGGIDPVIYQIKAYIFKNTSSLSQFYFYEVNNTIQEAAKIPLSVVMIRISSSITVFILSFLALPYLFYKHKESLLMLPAIILGIMAYKSGLRFTIYAIVPLALSFAFLLTFLINYLKIKNLYKNLLLALLTILALFPSLKHIYEYKTSTVLFKQEAQILDDLSKISNKDDYVIAWWDYGYPIRYYANTMTLIDGGKHIGRDNFAVSYALSKEQNESANISRLEVEYTKKLYGEKQNNTYEAMLKDYNEKDIDVFLSSLALKDFKLPQKTSDIYYYLPYRMLDIYPVITLFSNLDIKNGKQKQAPLFINARYLGQDENRVFLSNNISINSDFKEIDFAGHKEKINTFIISQFDGKRNYNQNYNFDKDAKIYVIFMQSYGKFLILDKDNFSSTFVQLFVLGQYDEDLFELVLSNELAKIYKLKK